jgi:cytochrome oxidase Cu insertion factor (SCO1/SenC/PrrC family)
MSKGILKLLFFCAAACVCSLALPQAFRLSAAGDSESKLGSFGIAPHFTLEEAPAAVEGKSPGSTVPFESNSLKDKVWVLNFFFTHCPSVCPKVISEVAALQRAFSEHRDLQFVSVSIDPERDDQERLARYAAKFSADSTRWKFLRGGKEAVDALSLGLGISAVGTVPDMHSVRLVLVDKNFQIRGYYDALDQQHLATLKNDLAKLLQ